MDKTSTSRKYTCFSQIQLWFLLESRNYFIFFGMESNFSGYLCIKIILVSNHYWKFQCCGEFHHLQYNSETPKWFSLSPILNRNVYFITRQFSKKSTNVLKRCMRGREVSLLLQCYLNKIASKKTKLYKRLFHWSVFMRPSSRPLQNVKQISTKHAFKG